MLSGCVIREFINTVLGLDTCFTSFCHLILKPGRGDADQKHAKATNSAHRLSAWTVTTY